MVRDAYYEILRKNRGVPPLDLEQRVHEKTALALDKNYEKFFEDLGMLTVINPEGKRGMIPKENLDDAINQGFQIP